MESKEEGSGVISPELISSWAAQGLGRTASYLTSQGKKDTAASALGCLPSPICPGPWRVLRVLHQHPDPPQQHFSARVLVRFSRNKSEGLRVPATLLHAPPPPSPQPASGPSSSSDGQGMGWELCCWESGGNLLQASSGGNACSQPCSQPVTNTI